MHWGPKKVMDYLRRIYPERHCPADSQGWDIPGLLFTLNTPIFAHATMKLSAANYGVSIDDMSILAQQAARN